MGRRTYYAGRMIARFIGVQTMKFTVRHAERFNDQPGGFVLACTHLSHIEPAIVSGLMRRKIDWMARIEFYKHWILARLLDGFDAFPVNRSGVSVRAIRTSIQRAQAGGIIGIFPEGGVEKGPNSILHGGPLKFGACTIAIRAGAPIIPVIVIGSRQLTRVRPWIPVPRRARLWVIFGPPILPPAVQSSRRAARQEMGQRLWQTYQDLFAELKQTDQIPPEHLPPRE